MGIQDFLFGTPDQTGQLDPETKAARNFLLNRMLQLQSAGPVNVPTYQAAMPTFATSGQNQLLAALGMEGISAPSMPTANVGGMNVYTSMPMQTSMESEFARRAPAQYDYLRSFYMDPVTGRMGSRAYNPDVMGLDAGGQRILINDRNPHYPSNKTARSFEVGRDEGFGEDLINV